DVCSSDLLVHQRFRRRLVRFAERSGELADAVFQRPQLAERVRDRFPHRLGGAEVAMLLQQRHPQPRRARHAAARGTELARDEAEERRLSTAVAAQNAPLLARGDGERDVTQYRRGTEFDRHSGEAELRHAHLPRSAAALIPAALIPAALIPAALTAAPSPTLPTSSARSRS